MNFVKYLILLRGLIYCSDEENQMKRIRRQDRLTPEESAKYRRIREQAESDLPDLIAQFNNYLVDRSIMKLINVIKGNDEVLSRHVEDNLFELEQEQPNEKHYFVISSLVQKVHKKDKPIWEFRPVKIVVAKTMMSAIKLHEEECGGRRQWIGEQDTRFDFQLGVDRLNRGDKVRIDRIRKDCILS